MTQARQFMLSMAALALTFGVTGQAVTTPNHDDGSLSNSDLVVVLNDSDQSAAGQTDENADQSAKMGREEGTHSGTRQGGPPETRAPKMSGSESGTSSGQSQQY
jgi:hypothetical protein